MCGSPERPDRLLAAHAELEVHEGRCKDDRSYEHEHDAARQTPAGERPDAAVEARRDGRERVRERADEQARERVEEGE